MDAQLRAEIIELVREDKDLRRALLETLERDLHQFYRVVQRAIYLYSRK